MKNILKVFISGLFVLILIFSASDALAATVTATANPSTIIKGESSTITWTSSSVTTCSYIATPTGGNGGTPGDTITTGFLKIKKVFAADTSLGNPGLGDGVPGFSGSGVVSPTQTTTYTINCTNGASTQVIVTVNTSALDLISSTSINGLTGNSLAINSTVTNIGPGTTKGFSNQITLSGDKVPQSSTFNSPALSSGQNSSSISNFSLLSNIAYTLTLCADNGNAIFESNEGNNCSERCFSYSERDQQIYSGVCSGGGNDNTEPSEGIAVTLSASPMSMTLPTNSTNLTWATTGSPESCIATGGWSWTKTTGLAGGTQTVSGLTAGTHTFDITCSKTGADDVTARAIVEVDSAVTQGITVSISANPSSMTLPADVTRLTWVTTGDPTSCEANSISWSGSKDANGGFEDRTGMTAGTYIFGIVCHKTGLADANSTTTVVVHPEGYPETTGDLTATNCTIGENESNCDTTLNWNTFDAKLGKVSAVTTPEDITVATGNSGAKQYTLSFGTRNFYLYNDGKELKMAQATASCEVGTSWSGTTCIKTELLPSGTIKATDCTISLNGSNCSTDLEWHTLNPLTAVTSAVTTPTDVTVATSNDGTKPYLLTFSAIPGSRTFYLYHNSRELARATALATCVADTVWNGVACVSADTLPTGTLDGADCTIPKDASTCTTTLTIGVTNPVPLALTNITKAGNIQVASGITPADKSGIIVTYPETKFFLNHNILTLAEKLISANCESGTGWDTSTQKCIKGFVDVCNNGATNYPLCTIGSDNNCLNGATNPPECTLGGNGTCLNGATNPPECTLGGNGACLNGATNPPACTTGGNGDGTDGTCTYGNWSSCSAIDCSESGVQTRTRSCTVTGNGTDSRFCFAQNCKVDGDKDGNKLNATLTATPAKIFKGRTSLLTWKSNASRCTAMPGYGYFDTEGKPDSDPDNNPVQVSPLVTTTYGIVCIKDGTTDTDYVTVIVNGFKLKEK